MISTQHPEQIFGEYTLKRKLGVGGMATVYYAIHNKLQREVAIKIIHEHFADDSIAVKRLAREAHISQKLRHSNIAPILAFNRVNNRPYLVMPYYAGKTLADYFEQPRAIAHTETLAILTQLAHALDYAHSKGVIHRDFKLENILISEDGIPVISDFGIAQIINTTRLTATGNFVGTPHYMPPEQASGGYDEIDYRADLYAFGIMAYLMLTGVFPFTGKDPIQLIIKHTTQDVPTPTLVNNKLPKAVDAILIRALAKTPDYRYPTASDFVQSLASAFENITPVTTLIDLKKYNPIETSLSAESSLLEKAHVYAKYAKRNSENEDFTTGGRHKTRVFSDVPQVEGIPAVGITQSQRNRSKKRSSLYVLVLSLVVLGSIAFMITLGRGDDTPITLDAETTEIIVENNPLLIERTQEVLVDKLIATSFGLNNLTINATPTTLARPNNSSSASDSSQPTSLSNPINTSNSPAQTSRPLPNNTPVPPISVPVQPTSVPTTLVELPPGNSSGNSNGNSNGNNGGNGNGNSNGRG